MTAPPPKRAGRALLGLRKAGAISSVGMRRLFYDRSVVFFTLLFPLLLVLVIGSVFGGSSQSTLGMVAPPADDLADDVVTALEEDEDLRVETYGTEASLRRAVERGNVDAGVLIPDGYTGRLTDGESVTVGFLARPGSQGQMLRPVVLGAVGPQSVTLQAARFAAEHGPEDFDAALSRATALEGQGAASGTTPVTTRTVEAGEAMFPPSLGQFDVGASQMLLLFMFVNGLASSAVLIKSRELGVTRRMLSTPTSVGLVLFGEGTARFTVTFLQGVYIMVGSALLFGVSWGSLPAASVLLFVFSLVAAGAAMLAGALFSNDQQAGSVGVMLGLGVAALGGSMAPLEVFSDTMRDVAHLTPHAWGNDAFATLVRHDGGLLDILPELGALVAMAAVLLAVATWRLRLAITKR